MERSHDMAVHGKLVVIGQGYVGLPLSMRAVEVGYRVIGFDVDKSRVDLLASGITYIEDVTSNQIKSALETDRFQPSFDPSDIDDFDFCVITVPTPLRDGLPDLSYITAASAMIGTRIKKGSSVILESTTYPGTTSELVLPELERLSNLVAGVDFYLGYSPERIDPGNPNFNFINTPKLVSGINKDSLEAISNFYKDLVDETVELKSPAEAEMAKLLENTFRHVNVALVNELAVFANELGIDVWEAIRGAASKPFGFMPFFPGPGVGGHCLPIDPSYLSWKVKLQLGENFRFVELANDINHHMPQFVSRRVMLGLNERGKAVKGSNIVLAGLAYKPNTSDARESPGVSVAASLIELGARVIACDPLVRREDVNLSLEWRDFSKEIMKEADVVVILAPHRDFDLNEIVENASYILDTRHVLVGENVEYL
ncbi:MAG: nucleotide sugar dehydrogenase [Acidimicrobiales bacterium]|nr:nucleotide sugar dehydrogenase [Acidimicrobiales bacterium]